MMNIKKYFLTQSKLKMETIQLFCNETINRFLTQEQL